MSGRRTELYKMSMGRRHVDARASLADEFRAASDVSKREVAISEMPECKADVTRVKANAQ